MSSLNRVQIIGHLGKDPKVSQTQSGKKVASFSVAVSEKWKDRDGNPQERTEWVPCVLWEGLADIAERFLKKGSKCLIEGKFTTRKYTDQSGADRYMTEVVCSGRDGKMILLDGRSGGSDGGYSSADYREASRGGGALAGDFDDMNSEVPF